MDEYPPYVKILLTGEQFPNTFTIGFVIDVCLWILAMVCQILTRVLTNWKYPLMENETSNELFSNASILLSFFIRLLPPMFSVIGLHRNVVASSFLLGKIVFIPIQILVVDRVQNSSGSGWLANQRFGFGFSGFQRLVNFRVFGFGKIARIFNFLLFFGPKFLDLVNTVPFLLQTFKYL